MRCLQCGKSVPLLKRLAGSEFCSDAHRLEYQREYSQLALGRLLQSQPIESEPRPLPAQPVATMPAPAAVAAPAPAPLPIKDKQPAKVAMNGAKTAIAMPAAPVRTDVTRSTTSPSAAAARPSGIAQPKPASPPAKLVNKFALQPPLPATEPAKNVPPDPAIAKPASIQKPAPKELRIAVVVTDEFARTLSSLAPDRPRRDPGMLPAALAQGRPIQWEHQVEMADAAVRPMERTLDLREPPRATPRIDLDLRILPPEILETHHQRLTIPVAPAAAPPEASLWMSPHGDFTGAVVALDDFADAQFSKADFEAPPLAIDFPAPVGLDSLPVEPQSASIDSEAKPEEVHETTPACATPAASDVAAMDAPDAPLTPQAAFFQEAAPSPEAARAPEAPIPEPALQSLPMAASGMAPGKTKPLQVFGAALFDAAAVQIPRPNGLPLRPLMVLVPAASEASAAPIAAGKNRRDDPRILQPASTAAPPAPIKPSLQAAKSQYAFLSEPNLGLPELQAQTPASPGALRTRKIVAAAVGAAVLGIGLLFFLGSRGDAGSKQPVDATAQASGEPVAGEPAPGGHSLDQQWIANFAPDAQRQRKVSVLRSSVNLPGYRLDFESSIQIKALGWVYRAQDAKNFYVSKIELQRPGQNPVFVIAHHAVINGVDQPRVEAPLHVTVPLGGFYKIRFAAVGNRFTTWVQDQKVDEWTDVRLRSGGAGLYSEGAEQSTLHGEFKVTPLQQ